jgi:hypothetical protein
MGEKLWEYKVTGNGLESRPVNGFNIALVLCYYRIFLALYRKFYRVNQALCDKL